MAVRNAEILFRFRVPLSAVLADSVYVSCCVCVDTERVGRKLKSLYKGIESGECGKMWKKL